MSGDGVATDDPPAVPPDRIVDEGAPPATVGPWLAARLGDPAWARCTVAPVGDGRSNLTFRVESAAGTLVLRRPPLGSVAATAHDMGREQRVLTALAGTAVPVPQVLAGEADASVLGAPFYVMEFVDGIVPSGPDAEQWLPAASGRHAAGEAAVDVLAALHSVAPESVGLADFGRPAGFMARQVRRWSTQWETWREGFAKADAPGGASGERPELTRLATRLATMVPSEDGADVETAVVHGDYRLENLVFDRRRPARVRAVLDWEMSTLGDPLADLGLLMIYWHQPDEEPVWRAAQYLPSASSRPGFPTRTEVIDHYARRRGLDAGRLGERIPFYVGFGAFKLAVVLAGVVARASAGAADARTGRGLQGVLDPLVALGHHVLDDGI